MPSHHLTTSVATNMSRQTVSFCEDDPVPVRHIEIGVCVCGGGAPSLGRPVVTDPPSAHLPLTNFSTYYWQWRCGQGQSRTQPLRTYLHQPLHVIRSDFYKQLRWCCHVYCGYSAADYKVGLQGGRPPQNGRIPHPRSSITSVTRRSSTWSAPRRGRGNLTDA